MWQMTWEDLIPKEVPLGYLKNGEEVKYKGDEIPYQQLAEYIGQRVLLESPRQSAADYKVIIVTSYHKEIDKVYEWKDGKGKLIGTCDRIGFTDDNRRHKENSWLSEMYCRNGRYHRDGYADTMYQLKRG